MEIKAIANKISEILLADWDPIGVKSRPEAANEYDTYAMQIVGMLVNGTTEDEIVKFLEKVSFEYMGLEPDERVTREVARKISKMRFGDYHE